MNILNSALSNIQRLTKNKKIEIYTNYIYNKKGYAKKELINIATCYAHIQPLKPFEIIKATDTTLDTVIGYKFYVSNNYAKLLSSITLPLKESFVKWDNKLYTIFAIKDWFKINGWLVITGFLMQDAYNGVNMIKVYNNTGVKITVDYYTIEPFHNEFDPSVWSLISSRDEIKIMIEECALLVNCFAEYNAYKLALDSLYAMCLDATLTAKIQAIESSQERLKTIDNTIQKFESFLIQIDTFEQFKNDVKTKNKLLMTKQSAERIKAELEDLKDKIIQE